MIIPKETGIRSTGIILSVLIQFFLKRMTLLRIHSYGDYFGAGNESGAYFYPSECTRLTDCLGDIK